MPGPRTLPQLLSNLRRTGRPLATFQKGDRVYGATGMSLRSRYSYVLTSAPGDLSDTPDFQPAFSPGEMLMMGVFEGKYLNDCVREFPAEWFYGALAAGRLSPEGPNAETCNFFGVGSRQPLSVWKQNGWAPSSARRGRTDDHYRGQLGDPARNPDERGWFQWYCRFWMGRRLPEIDAIQIKRWRAFRRHAGALRGGCPAWQDNPRCRLRERQALLQWAYDPFV